MTEEGGSNSDAMPNDRVSQAPIEVDDSTIDEAIISHPRLVVDCWAPWCAPCRAMSPIIDELAVEQAGSVKFAKLNLDLNQATAMRFGVMSIPTLLFFKEGQLEDIAVGALSRNQIEFYLNALKSS